MGPPENVVYLIEQLYLTVMEPYLTCTYPFPHSVSCNCPTLKKPTSSVCLHSKTAHLNKSRKKEAKIYALKKFIPKPIEGQFILNIQKVPKADTNIVSI